MITVSKEVSNTDLRELWNWFYPSATLFSAMSLILLLVGFFGNATSNGDFLDIPAYQEKALFIFIIGTFISAMRASTKVK